MGTVNNTMFNKTDITDGWHLKAKKRNSKLERKKKPQTTQTY